MAQQQPGAPPPETKAPDLMALAFQLIAQNPILAAVVGGGIVGLWYIGRQSKKGKPDELYTEAELELALVRIRAKKSSASPEVQELVASMKHILERLDKIAPVPPVAASQGADPPPA